MLPSDFPFRVFHPISGELVRIASPEELEAARHRARDESAKRCPDLLEMFDKFNAGFITRVLGSPALFPFLGLDWCTPSDFERLSIGYGAHSSVATDDGEHITVHIAVHAMLRGGAADQVFAATGSLLHEMLHAKGLRHSSARTEREFNRVLRRWDYLPQHRKALSRLPTPRGWWRSNRGRLVHDDPARA